MGKGVFGSGLVMWAMVAQAWSATAAGPASALSVRAREDHLQLVVPARSAGVIVESKDLQTWRPWARFPARSTNLTHFLERTNLDDGPRFFRFVPASVPAPTNFTYVPPGEFLMGSPESELGRDMREARHRARVHRGFWMAQYEVTVRDWVALMGVYMNHSSPPVPDDSQVAMSNVSWMECMEYCRRYTEREAAAGRLPQGMNYRLPTESEWEYAARAGTTTRFYYGEDPEYRELDGYAWYGDNADGQPHVGGEKRANQWGLYDMLGNVFEWCLDPETAYPGSDYTPLRARIYRGGSHYCPEYVLRCAHRTHVAPMDQMVPLAGLRLVLGFEPDSLRSVEEVLNPGYEIEWSADHTEATIRLQVGTPNAQLLYTTDMGSYFPVFAAYTAPVVTQAPLGVKVKATKKNAVTSDTIRFEVAQAHSPQMRDLGVMVRVDTDEGDSAIEYRWDEEDWQEYSIPLAWRVGSRIQARCRHPGKLTSEVEELAPEW
jgi:formylglycine-generating enzyme required for sulfatase activity